MRNEAYNQAHDSLKALSYGIKRAQFPGAWQEWDVDQPLDQFMLALHTRPATFEPDPSGRRSGRWNTPAYDALRAIPFLYRCASQYLLARHALHYMGLGNEVDAVALSRELHDKLDFMRSFFAGYGWNRRAGEST